MSGAWPDSPPPHLPSWNQGERRIFPGGVCKFCRDFNFTASQLSKLPSQAGYLNLSPTFPSAAGLLELSGISSLQPTALGCWSGTEPSLSKVIRKKGPARGKSELGVLWPQPASVGLVVVGTFFYQLLTLLEDPMGAVINPSVVPGTSGPGLQ